MRLLSCFLLGSLLLLPAAGPAAAAEAEADEKLLTEAGLKTDGPALLDIFRKQTLRDTDRSRIEALIAQLGDDDFSTREKASAELVDLGPLAQPLLRQALKHADPEVVRRAEKCLEQTEKTYNSGVTAAAARLLAKRKPEGTAEALLGFLPYAADELVFDEVQAALTAVALRDGKPEPALVQALQDKLVVRRAVAAAALVRSGAAELRPALRRLLQDAEPLVRQQVALALAEAKEKEAVPVLIALLAELPQQQGWRIEDTLLRLAGETAPAVTLGSDAAGRQRCRDAWAEWWQKNGAKADLSRLTDGGRLLGYTLLVEMNRGVNGRVTELGADGKVRWQLDGLQYPVDAQLVGENRLLVAEYTLRKVSERDLKGKVIWEKTLTDMPTGVQRLPNGNTLIICRQALVEVDREGKEVLRRAASNGVIMGAQKLRDGQIAVVTSDGMFRRLDADGKVVKSFALGGTPYVFGNIEVLPNGRVLVPLYSNNVVREYDADGKVVWEASTPRPTTVQRLPNGHTLVGSALSQQVVEIDRAGKEVWQHRADFRLTKVRRR